MRIAYDLSGQNSPVIKKYKLYGAAADMVAGCLVEPGLTTACTSVIYSSTSAPTMVVGLLTQIHDYSVTGDWTYTSITSAASLAARGDVDIRPLGVYVADLAACATQTVTVAASAGAGANEVTLNTNFSAADTLEGSWIYNATTDELRYVEAHAAVGTATFSSNIGTTAWTTVAAYIVPGDLYGQTTNTGLGLNATCNKVILEGNQTGAWCRVLMTEMSADGVSLDRLVPEKDNNTYANAQFKVHFVILKHAFSI
jgi:hypothetical protein